MLEYWSHDGRVRMDESHDGICGPNSTRDGLLRAVHQGTALTRFLPQIGTHTIHDRNIYGILTPINCAFSLSMLTTKTQRRCCRQPIRILAPPLQVRPTGTKYCRVPAFEKSTNKDLDTSL